MSDQKITRLENHLERLIEGAFAHLFGQALRPHDIVVHLSRALETGIVPSNDEDTRPFAPDQYIIRLSEHIHDHLSARQPSLNALLIQHMVDLAAATNCRLRVQPSVTLIADGRLKDADIRVEVAHQLDPQHTTQMLSQPELHAALARTPRNPVLVINGNPPIPLLKPVINIGRGRDNDIIVEDRYASRRHVQLRLRHGVFMVFDANSQGGIEVNDVPVREHRLQPGDVIRIGKTRLLYLEDTAIGDDQTGIITLLPP